MARKSKPRVNAVTSYVNAVLSGEIVSNRLMKLACERHLRDVENGHKRGIHFDPDTADHVIGFFPAFLRHTEGRYADKPFILSPHQQFIVGSLFGWLKADGYRRFRRAYIEIGKGDGKTPLASGILLYGLIMDGEEGAELYCAAVARKQSEIAFRDCRHMAEKSLFSNRLEFSEHNISYPATRSFIRPVSSEAKSLDGLRVQMSILDEVHEHRSGSVINKIVAGNKGRMQPMNIEITNSGHDRTSVCWQHHEYSREILEGLNEDDNWFTFICGLDICLKCQAENKSFPQDDCANCDHWWEESTWAKAMPNIGISPTIEYVRGEVQQALRMPDKALDTKRLNMCIWTETFIHWMPMDEWDTCGKSPINIESLKGRRCYGGIDLGDTSDTTALVLAFPPLADPIDQYPVYSDGEIIGNESGVFILLLYVWVPSEMKRRTGSDRDRFRNWIQQGFIEATEGNRIDHRHVAKRLHQLRQQFDIKILGMDPYHADNFSTFAEEEAGFTTEERVFENSGSPLLYKYPQNMPHLASPTQNFLDMVLKHKITHGGNPVFRWMVGNVVVNPDSNGNVKPEKGKSADKIDGAVAAIMALSLAIKHAKAEEPVYFSSLRPT